MMNRLTRQNRVSLRERLRRLDRIAAEVNVVLVVIALGLATLDATFFVTQKVVNNLPPVTYVSDDALGTAGK